MNSGARFGCTKRSGRSPRWASTCTAAWGALKTSRSSISNPSLRSRSTSDRPARQPAVGHPLDPRALAPRREAHTRRAARRERDLGVSICAVRTARVRCAGDVVRRVRPIRSLAARGIPAAPLADAQLCPRNSVRHAEHSGRDRSRSQDLVARAQASSLYCIARRSELQNLRLAIARQAKLRCP